MMRLSCAREENGVLAQMVLEDTNDDIGAMKVEELGLELASKEEHDEMLVRCVFPSGEPEFLFPPQAEIGKVKLCVGLNAGWKPAGETTVLVLEL